MTFAQYVQQRAEDAVRMFPPERGIYAVTFRIDSVDQDPRCPYVAVGYTTETDAAEAAGQTPDAWEARWSYAYFPATGLEGVRVVGLDPDGARAFRHEALAQGLWYDDGDEPGDRDEQLTEWFYEVCVGTARHLHDSGRIVEALGRPVPVLLYDMFDPDAMFELTSAANPVDLVGEFMAEADRE
ncbi:hypothetical protein GTW43_10325 [Streptomyces sp. SID5785]|uniref:hypothetical protein n=1 Tax=Streptomyces sp. SID5785 TaxID=2690309 RepID=UPI0013612D7B|nr:hypothetical protein [Streptomyces sp. SID5785]MZD05476.1 hypothetical protein [Streptomyces sp. SID5785]